MDGDGYRGKDTRPHTPLEPKLLVMLGRIGEALQIVYEVLHIV